MKASVVRIVSITVVLVVAAYAYVTLRGPLGLHALAEKRAQIRQVEQRNEVLQREIERKLDHIKRLKDNSVEQELEIRDRLKLVRPNEKVYIIGEPDRK